MGKVPTSLLIIVLQLSAIDLAWGDEQVRQVQAALRKRHLYYGDPNGEMSPALTLAIAHYQERKGFLRTGSIDSETRASLGLADPSPQAAPFVVENNGGARGANGEALPDSLLWPPDQYPVRFGLIQIEHASVAPPVAALDTELNRTASTEFKPASPRRRVRARPQKETNPIVLAFQSLDHAVKSLFGETNPPKKRARAKGL